MKSIWNIVLLCAHSLYSPRQAMHCAAALSALAPHFWGKLERDRDTGELRASLALVDHCIDVATVFRQLCELAAFRRTLSLLLGRPPTEIDLDRLAVIALLHDFGKCNWGFQAKADPQAKETAGHVLEAVAWLLAFSDDWPGAWRGLITEIIEWFDNDEGAAAAMLLAAISHHGRPVSLNDYENSRAAQSAKRFWQPRGSIDPTRGLTALAETARACYPGAFTQSAPIVATPALQQRFAGLVMLADWVGSDTQFFPFQTPDGQTRQAFAQAAARRALAAIGLSAPEPRRPKSFSETFGFPPTPLQSALAHTLALDDENRLLLIESDTGSGKTEAALAWFFRLYAEGRVDGIYFALPTRVAARELYGRVVKATDAAFEADCRPGPVLLAAPGYVKVDGLPALPDPHGALWDDNARDLRRERLWSSERPKRFLAAPIAVGTIDQALLSALQVKHGLLRSVCLDRHLLVVDEVHASDPYMREVLRALLDGHLRRGGHAMLLSATLGEVAASAFFNRAPKPIKEAVARPYPAITSFKGVTAVQSSATRRIEVSLTPTLLDDEDLVPEIVAALEQRARVLVVCNTVARANALFRSIESLLAKQHPELLDALFALQGVRCPHHGRFAREDRERLDAAVTGALGKGSPDGARLLIGTQTLEQSLDIDADWLITDLAPMDVLLQRVGRLHRHPRSGRPSAFAKPKVRVRVPSVELASYLRPDGTLRGPAGLGTVYVDGRILLRTWQALAQRPSLSLPQDARELIEGVTHPDALQSLPPPWLDHAAHIEGKALADVRAALSSVLDERPFGELHYADKSEKVLTRLGRPTFDLALTTPCPSPFGASLQRVQIPAHWLPESDVPDCVSAELFADGFRFVVGGSGFRYTRFGLEKDDV